MNLSAPFIMRPVMTTFVMLAIIIAGYQAFCKLPVSDLPPIDYPKIFVSSNLSGASPEVMLNEVTIPIERELMHVKAVQEIHSRSSYGNSHIELSFDLNKDMQAASRDVQQALDRAILPKEMDQKPALFRQEASHDPIMFIVINSSRYSVGELRNIADATILPRLRRVDGVADVQAYGSAKSIWIRVNPKLLAARKIGFNQVIDAVRKQTQKMALGSIKTGSKLLSIELAGELSDAKSLEEIQIANDGVLLKDVAEISDASNEKQEFGYGTADAVIPALLLSVQKVSDANTVHVSKGVQEVLQTIKKELPANVGCNLWFDKAIWIQQSILDVEYSLLFAFVLVIVVIYMSLGRFMEALIPSAALPLSLIGTFILMYGLDYSLDLLSLLALTLAVGFVVDDAIVVVENIVRHKEKGLTGKKAALMGSKQIAFTIISMTLSLVAVFIPLLFMQDMIGKLFKEFSVTLSVAILVSGFISLSLTPMLCSRFLNSSHSKKERTVFGLQLYGKTLKTVLGYPKTVFIAALLCMLITVPLYQKLSVNLIPPEDRGFLFAGVMLPSGVSHQESQHYQQKVEKLIQKNENVESFVNGSFEHNLFFFVRLKDREKRAAQTTVIAALQEQLETIAGIQSFISGWQLIHLGFEFGKGGQYALSIQGLDEQVVADSCKNILQELSKISEISFSESSLKNDFPKLLVQADEDVLCKFGLTRYQLAEFLSQAYGILPIGSIHHQNREQKIYMELQPEYRNNPKSLSHMYIAMADDELIPIKSIATWKETLGTPNYERLDGLSSASIRFSFADGISPDVGIKKVEAILHDMPQGIKASLSGSAKQISKTSYETLLLLIAAAIVMYIVLGILYESFIHPLTILSSLPFAGLGGILTLFLFNEPISIFSAVGFLLLIGIVKKNGIMMVDYALEAQKNGLNAHDAIYEGCLVRYRPIMMTTVAAIMGAIPIAIGFGEGSEMRQGLGLVIVGGLLFSQLLTLYVTPVLFLLLDRLRR